MNEQLQLLLDPPVDTLRRDVRIKRLYDEYYIFHGDRSLPFGPFDSLTDAKEEFKRLFGVSYRA